MQNLLQQDSTIQDVLALTDRHAFAVALDRHVCTSPRVAFFGDMRPAEQVVWCIGGLRGQVYNGGFHQFFENSTGDYAYEALTALRMIGADHAADLLERAMASFPDGPSSDWDERMAEIHELSENDEEELHELDQAFYAYLDELSDMLRAYVAQHADDFACPRARR